MLQKADERSVRRIRLLVARASQDCGAMHPQLFELGAVLDLVLERNEITAEDLRGLEKLAGLISDEAEDCVRTLHCDFVRRDLACELRELNERLGESLAATRATLVTAGGNGV
jgi:hypothetical protein